MNDCGEVCVTRGDRWLQRILYTMIVLLGIYIIYKGGGLLLESSRGKQMLEEEEIPRRLEDAAAGTWAPGYAAAVGENSGNWMAGWMRQAVPVYSYLAEHGQETDDGRPGVPEARADKGSAGAAESEVSQPEVSESEVSESEASGRAESDVAQAQTNGESAESDVAQAQMNRESAGITESEASGRSDLSASQTQTSGEVQESQQESVSSDGDLPQETAHVREVAARALTGGVPELLLDYSYVLNEYFIVDQGTVADETLIDAERLLSQDLRIVKNSAAPQILIYHTHGQETFADSVPGDESTTIVGMGEVLASLLEARGYGVIHDTGSYDLVDGVLDRSAAYDYARASVEEILRENPTIEVIIDLHRDGVDGQKFVTEIDGKLTSMIMFFNGISRNSQDEPITYLANPYITQNLAFSFQLELKAREQYPGYTRNIYLKAERFNLHLRPRSLLIEAGTQLNTVEEERNAMAPLASLLDQVLSGR